MFQNIWLNARTKYQ
uniref:Uncharacterized protein n=1 Tax=Arundo donax TaxID=35708 RepID=A0A0A9ACU4_ARUDO